MNVWRAGEQVMSYKNVLVAVKTVFQNISVADLSLVLSYHVNFLIQSAHRRLDKSILCDWHLHYHDYFAAAYYSSRLLTHAASSNVCSTYIVISNNFTEFRVDMTEVAKVTLTKLPIIIQIKRRKEIVPCENITEKKKFIWMVATRLRMLRATL